MRELTATPHGADGLVAVTVAGSGALVDLVLDERVRRHSTAWIAQQVLAVNSRRSSPACTVLRTRSHHGGPRGADRQDLLDELQRNGVKHNPDDIVEIGRGPDEKIIFLENGNDRAGLQHIIGQHADDFANIGIPRDKVGSLVFNAVTNGRVVGVQGTRPIYEVVFEGKVYQVAVTVGSNGFIVGANPVGH